MILVDTSIWIDYLRSQDVMLQELLQHRQVLGHPYVTAELALDSIQNRQQFLQDLNNLPQAKIAQHQEIMMFIDHHQLFGLGIGLIDVHLLASCYLMQCKLWTRDKRLLKVATALGIAMQLLQ